MDGINSSESQMRSLPCPPLSSPFVLLPKDNHKHDPFIYFMLLINAILATLTTLANFFVVCTILKTPALKTPHNILLLSLSLSDLLVGVITIPSNGVSKVAELRRDVDLLCLAGETTAFSLWIFSMMSLITLTAIAVDRYLAIKFHLRYHTLVTVQRYGILHGSIWIFIVTIGILRVFFRERQFMAITSFLYVSLSVTNVYLIWKISRVIKRHAVQIQDQHNAAAARHLNSVPPRIKKSVNVMLFIVGAFLGCYLPYYGIMLVYIIVGTESTIAKGYSTKLTVIMIMLNSLLNPVIYCWRIQEFRQAAYRQLAGIRLCRVKQQSDS